jgi:Trk K+ transport system NAD-binding subunit
LSLLRRLLTRYLAAGVMRAHAPATVLSNDALNVFITLSARALNPNLAIVARRELSSTESKLLHAGADKVVLPTHIGAERIAELILHEESARFIEGLERSTGFQRVLHNFGMELEVVTAAPQSPAVRMTVAAIEKHAKGAFFIVQINRRDGAVHTAPPPTAIVGEGDGVVLIGRPNRAALLPSLFDRGSGSVRAGEQTTGPSATCVRLADPAHRILCRWTENPNSRDAIRQCIAGVWMGYYAFINCGLVHAPRGRDALCIVAIS